MTMRDAAAPCAPFDLAALARLDEGLRALARRGPAA